jgi:hypothetical protein
LVNIIRETGSIELLKVIVHIIDHHNSQAADKSQADIIVNTMNVKVKTFIQEHIRLSIQNNDSRLAKYTIRETVVQNLVNDIIIDPNQHFIINSQHIADSLFKVLPKTATPGCIIIALYTNVLEHFIAIIKLDKHDNFAYQHKPNGSIDLEFRGTGLPSPDKRSRLHKLAVLRSTNNITDQQWDTKPGLLILDKQVADFSKFFYESFLESTFLMSDATKSEKLISGLDKYLKTVPELSVVENFNIVQSYGRKIINREEFTIDESAKQIFSPFFENNIVRLNAVVEGLEQALINEGIGDNNLRGEITPKIERLLGFKRIRTTEKILISVPSDQFNTKVEITDSRFGDGKDILIKNIHLKE